jgi:carbamoyltransferase
VGSLLEGVGTLARFVNLEKLTDLHPEMLAYVNDDTRDARRYRRQTGRPQGEPLRTLVQVTTDVDQALVDGVRRACEALLSEVTVVCGEDEVAHALSTFTARIVVASVDSAAFHSVTEQTLSLWPPTERGDAMRALGADWSRPKPPGTWHPSLDADLWIADVPGLDIIAAGGDPVPLDRFLVDACGIDGSTVPWFTSAREAQSPWLALEAVIPGGELPVQIADRPRKRPTKQPLTILGIASTTLANHAAVVLRDGEVVAAIQEERPRRRKQLGWSPPGEPGVTVVSDPTFPLEASWPRRAIQSALETAGITLAEVDHLAYNGIPARYFPTYSVHDPARPPQTIFDGRDFYVPHHLAHAASAFRVSGMEDAFVFTVDGRGERETAAFFEVDGGGIRRVFDVLVGEDSLIGGVYEYLTTILGFGHHGAGSTMGLAPYGQPSFDLSDWLSARSRSDFTIHDRGLDGPFGHLKRKRGGPMSQGHKDLAASAQLALEETVLAFVRDGLAGRPVPRLCLAGGVALNCSMNQRLRVELGVEEIYVQPAANDAGTALGAAAEAHWELTGSNLAPMTHARLGPGYSTSQVQATLERFGLTYTTPEDLPGEVARRLVDQQVVAWFDGRLEFGPRALGARSILADPRTQQMQDRVNAHKGRQAWRPFGPSILAGHESDWFLTPFHSPFMLFTLPVRPERRDQIAAVVHVDGTSRPQSVTADDNPAYHAVISAFHRLTGVPMVLNTSFNTAFEPIVQSPEDAIASFLQLGLDALAIEGCLVTRPEA